MAASILAIDIGTQSTRAAIVAEDGTILGIEQTLYDVDSPKPGWAQQRADAWWEDTCRNVRTVLDATDITPGSITAVSTCGQMHGPVGIDDRGCVTTEWVQLWCDKRCWGQCERLRQSNDEGALSTMAANPINPAWSGLKVRWYKDNLPEAYEATRWFLVPKDFINFRLTGTAATDPSEASGSFLWDHEKDAYSGELARVIGVDLERFAPVRPSHAVIGAVTEDASRQTGIPAGAPVVAGGGDFPVSMLGFGVVGEGTASDVTGSSTLFATHSERPLIHPAVQNLRHVIPGWIPFTILDCGGMSVKWYRDLIRSASGQEVSFESLVEMASAVPEGSDGLLFYPYMLGERRRENTAARGGFFGITLNHTAGHFARAVMEGVALAMGRDAELFKRLGLEVSRIICGGGGTRNELWNQIKANVVQLPLEVSAEPEAGLKGAALLGAAGVGLIDDPGEEALRRSVSRKTIQPCPESAAWRQAALAEFGHIYDHMLGFWQSTASAAESEADA